MSQPRVAFEIAQGDESWGKIVFELDEQKTPQTTKNFLEYVDAGFFDGTIFHRIMSNFMIQGGGYTALQEPKRKGLREPIQNEAQNGIEHKKGTLAMARTSEPHSATSQFFINVSDNDFLNHPGQDGWGYCAFGRLVEGMDVVDRVRSVEVRADPQTGEQSQPVNPPQITKASRAEA